MNLVEIAIAMCFFMQETRFTLVRQIYVRHMVPQCQNKL